MFKVSVMYPNAEGCTFDMRYYLDKHMPMCRQALASSLEGDAVDQGIGGAEPGSKPPFVAIGHLFFETPEALQAAVGTLQVLAADIPNFTNVQPVVQVAQVMA